MRLVEEMNERFKDLGLTKAEMRGLIDNVFYNMFIELKETGEFKLPLNYGKFRVKKVPARTATVFGEVKKLPARTKVTFRAGKTLKEMTK